MIRSLARESNTNSQYSQGPIMMIIGNLDDAYSSDHSAQSTHEAALPRVWAPTSYIEDLPLSSNQPPNQSHMVGDRKIGHLYTPYAINGLNQFTTTALGGRIMYDASDLEYAKEQAFTAIKEGDLMAAKKWSDEVQILQFELDLQS